jgi:hypothetical protein
MTQEETAKKVISELVNFNLIPKGYIGVIERYIYQVYAVGYDTGRRSHSNQKPVIQLNHYGEVLNVFESAAQASRVMAKETGTKPDSSGITKCCNGKAHTAYGFIWKWK